MSDQLYGGNIIHQLNLEQIGRQNFATEPYTYYYYQSIAAEEIPFNELHSFSVYVLNHQGLISIVETDESLSQGDMVQVENTSLTLKIRKEAATLLIAGTARIHKAETEIRVVQCNDIYKVIKPWGHELWISGEHPEYCLKQIFIKSSHKTSLQYHRIKQETNVLFEGEAHLHYKGNEQIPNDEVTEKDLNFVRIIPVTSVDVTPNTLHRLEAITDIVLYETSTPYLDDVVRVSDDANRPNGRIQREHGN